MNLQYRSKRCYLNISKTIDINAISEIINWTILATLNLYVALILPTKFQSNPSYVLGEVSFEEFQDDWHGDHLAVYEVEGRGNTLPWTPTVNVDECFFFL